MRSSVLIASVLAAFGAMSCSAAAPKQTTSGYQGTYITSKSIKDASDLEPVGEIVQPSASGVFIRINWDTIQPEQHRFDWSLFDAIAVPASKAGKNLSVGIIAGTYAPRWIGETGGARYSTFRISQRGCWDARIYWPWDRAYQDSYLAMMRNLKQHLIAIGAYDNLKIVKMSYIAQHTLELRLPRRAAGTYQGCTLPDSEAIWIRAGYTPQRVLSGYDRVIDAMANDIFPGRIISQATQKGDSFPDIGDTGQPMPDGAADETLVSAIVRACIAAAGTRCAIQHQSLQTLGPVGERVLTAQQKGATIGWQTARNRGRARCQDENSADTRRRLKHAPRIPCTAQGYRQVLDKGIAAGATYLELWPSDVSQFPDVVKAADSRMRASRE